MRGLLCLALIGRMIIYIITQISTPSLEISKGIIAYIIEVCPLAFIFRLALEHALIWNYGPPYIYSLRPLALTGASC